jgi:ribosome-associated translation inhibitor RaiA
MIEAAGKAWPEDAFWLTTGISDPAYGHVAPGENGYPERSERKENSAALFKKQVEMKAEALKVARTYLEADGIPDYEPDDRFLASAVQIVLQGYELSPNVDLSSYKAMKKAYPTVSKLRSAEILRGNEMSDALYESIDSVLEAVEKLLATVPEHAKERLEKILASEQKRQAAMKRLSGKE